MDSKPMVLVTWIDSCSYDPWEELDNLNLDSALIFSVGWLLSETNESIILAMNYDQANQAASQYIAIPKAVVRKVTILN